MSMYSSAHTREQQHREDSVFQSFVGLHSERLVSVVVELIFQLVLIGVILCGMAVLALACAVVHFTVVWALPEHEPVDHPPPTSTA